MKLSEKGGHNTHGHDIAEETGIMNCIIYPCEKKKEYWDLWMTFILIVTCIFTPLNIAFDYQQRSSSIEVIDYLIDFIYFMDIIVIFNSAYYNE